jgi:hypothetical protein
MCGGGGGGGDDGRRTGMPGALTPVATKLFPNWLPLAASVCRSLPQSLLVFCAYGVLQNRMMTLDEM